MITESDDVIHTPATCATSILAVKDALEALNGRWKLLILLSLTTGAKRFKQISKDLSILLDDAGIGNHVNNLPFFVFRRFMESITQASDGLAGSRRT